MEIRLDIQGLRLRYSPLKVSRLTCEDRLRSYFLRSVSEAFSELLNKESQDSPIRSILVADTSSDASFQNASQWLRDCCNSHYECGSGQEQPLPTRVLDIGLDPYVRIHESNKGVGRYVCLSYCWGTTPSIVLKTSQQNLLAMKTQIPWSDLPKTFQDTINVIRKLHVRWLWVDSLCITQDDMDDWRKESGAMASIYQNAYITIMATASSDAEGGCFTLPSHQIHDSHKIETDKYNIAVVDFDGKPVEAYARIGLKLFFGSFTTGTKWIKNSLPPLSRAWVHQERLMSPRVLHFAGYELIWEWQKVTTCECGASNETQSSPKVEYASCFMSGPYYSDAHWSRLVAAHLNLEMIFEKDLLPTLSGFAKQRLSSLSHLGDEYLAGLWKTSLVSDLSRAIQSDQLVARP